MSTKYKYQIFHLFAAGVSLVGFAAIYRAAVKINTGLDPDFFQKVISFGFGTVLSLVVFSVLVGKAKR